VLGEALEFWLGPAWGHLISIGADFTVAASDDALSGWSVWSLTSDTFQFVHTLLVFVGLLLNGFSVG